MSRRMRDRGTGELRETVVDLVLRRVDESLLYVEVTRWPTSPHDLMATVMVIGLAPVLLRPPAGGKLQDLLRVIDEEFGPCCRLESGLSISQEVAVLMVARELAGP